MYLLMKRGLYWRPNSQGYTGLKSEAGRYSKEQATAWADHSRSETTAIPEDVAADVAPGCSLDVAIRYWKARALLAEGELEGFRSLAKKAG